VNRSKFSSGIPSNISNRPFWIINFCTFAVSGFQFTSFNGNNRLRTNHPNALRIGDQAFKPGAQQQAFTIGLSFLLKRQQ